MATSSGITTLGTRTFFYGGSSGIDTSALVTAAYNAKKLPADRIDTQVTKNTTRATALNTLQTLTQAVQDSMKSLRKDYSILATNTSYFGARSGTLSSSSSTPATSLVGVTIDNGTTLGNYELQIQQKASAQKVGSNTTFTDSTTALGYTGSFDISESGKTAATVNITSGMSLTDVAAAINGSSTTSGVTASVLKISATSYQLVLAAKDTNKPITIGNITGTDVMTGLGVTASSGGAFSHQIQPAQGSSIILDGTTTTRDTNDYSDLISGVHINILNAEPGTKIQLGITNDNSQAKTGITGFVDAYNKLRDFVVTNQTAQSDGSVSSDAPLFGDFMLRSLSTTAQSLLGTQYGSSTNTVQTLRDIGVTLDAGGKLTVDETKLDTALTDKFDEVQSLFETSVSSDNSNFRMMGNTSLTQNLTAALDITYSGGAVTSVSVGGDPNLFTISGGVITGKSGTAYDGMTFAYIGTTSATVNITMKQGLADVLNNTLNTYTSVTNGTLQQERNNIEVRNVDLENKKADILTRADDYRQKLIDKYAGYEAKQAASKTILAQIQAILNANNSNN